MRSGSVAAASIVGAAAFLLAACASDGPRDPTDTRSPSFRIGTQLPHCNVLISGFSMDPLRESDAPVHTAAEARAVIDNAPGGPEHITEVVPAMVTDPTGVKLGLPGTARIMWVFDVQDIYEIPTEGPAPLPGVTAGTVFHSLWLVDDETLKNGGGIACGQ